MARTVTVMFALRAQHEAIQAARGADGREALAASGEQLVYVSLVAHVEQEVIVGRVKNIVHGDGQLDNAQVGTKVPARAGEHRNEFPANLLRKLGELG